MCRPGAATPPMAAATAAAPGVGGGAVWRPLLTAGVWLLGALSVGYLRFRTPDY